MCATRFELTHEAQKLPLIQQLSGRSGKAWVPAGACIFRCTSGKACCMGGTCIDSGVHLARRVAWEVHADSILSQPLMKSWAVCRAVRDLALLAAIRCIHECTPAQGVRLKLARPFMQG
jgi:hypothetical protein